MSDWPFFELGASRIAVDNGLRIPRVHRVQQYPVGNIIFFFTYLGEWSIMSCLVYFGCAIEPNTEKAWKRSMCSRPIRLMEETRIDKQIMGFQALSSVAENG
jgi:hypothetical protein